MRHENIAPPPGCLAFDQCPDGPMPMMWQCALSADGIPIEIEGPAYMAALPFAKTSQCLQVQSMALGSHLTRDAHKDICKHDSRHLG